MPSLSSFLISILPYLSKNGGDADDELLGLPNELNRRLLDLVKPDSPIPVESTVTVFLAHLRHERSETRMATLNWIRHFNSTQPANVCSKTLYLDITLHPPLQMFRYIDRFFPVLLELLSDPADDVLMLDIILVTEICGQPKQQLDMRSLKLGEELSQEVRHFGFWGSKNRSFCVSLISLNPSLQIWSNSIWRCSKCSRTTRNWWPNEASK